MMFLLIKNSQFKKSLIFCKIKSISSYLDLLIYLFEAIDTEYPKVFALALVFSLLVTVLVLGGALFAYHRWQKSKSNENGPNRGFRLAMPNRRANYQDQMLNLDSSGDNKFPNGSLDLEFTNPAYEENKVENDDLNFTDFTGSREMGIDIGTLEGPMSPKQPAMVEEISEKKDDLKHLRNILDECLKSESLDSNHDSSNVGMNKLYRASNLENLKIQEDEINFEYFEEFRKNQHTQDARKDSMAKEKPGSIDEENSFDEKTESVANIFSTNIEQNLPELFGQYLDESKANHSEQMEKQLDQESLESVPKDSLNVSTDEPSEDEDFKPIDKNAFKNFRVESNNKFVIDESKSSFKEMIKLQKESTESGASSPKEFDHQALKDKENKIDMFKFLSGGIGNF
ncbi:hypothetical protein BpHYR1_004974 [Brachionus plicatilis]|uniref:Uncharacterized protein n=1 Tax=Brachionus plicatilis TaxID=10195 RepID=A0A3M7T0Y5_BRAPC|nr:hypothetical protein BpHYR1_004974 [Brachionus plicatilis]